MHLAGIKASAGMSEHLICQDRPANAADDGAVLDHRVIDLIDSQQAAGARQVLDDDNWIAGDVLAEAAGNCAGGDVVGSSGAEPNYDLDRSATIELRDGLLVKAA